MSIFEFMEQYGLDLSSTEIDEIKAIVNKELSEDNLRLQKSLDRVKPKFNPSLELV